MQQDPECQGKALRVAVRGGGCSGYTYALDFDEPDEDDVVFKAGELEVCVDAHSHGLLGDTTIDYIDEPFQKGFVFENPNATRTCGCGKSWA